MLFRFRAEQLGLAGEPEDWQPTFIPFKPSKPSP